MVCKIYIETHWKEFVNHLGWKIMVHFPNWALFYIIHAVSVSLVACIKVCSVKWFVETFGYHKRFIVHLFEFTQFSITIKQIDLKVFNVFISHILIVHILYTVHIQLFYVYGQTVPYSKLENFPEKWECNWNLWFVRFDSMEKNYYYVM